MTPPDHPPPPFGHQLRQHFGFEADYVNLNNGRPTPCTVHKPLDPKKRLFFFRSGAYGSVPVPVSAAVEATRKSIEGNVDRLIKLHLPEYLTPARHRMAKFIGAGPDEVVFVPNASHGLNTVLRNLVWNTEDIIVTGKRPPHSRMPQLPLLTWPVATTTYNAIERTARYISDLLPHPSVSAFELNFPTTRASILQAFRVHLDELCAKLQTAQRKIGDGTKLKIVAIIDSIASNPGVYLPWKEMADLCRERGILTVIDAAHSVGQEPNINLSEAEPDFWVAVRLIL